MKKYRVDYKVNMGSQKDKTITVMIEGTDMEDVKERFHRTTQILAGSQPSGYEAEIVMVSDASKSQVKRYAAQGMPGA